ncbi:hypothetical protein V6N12_075582 [Hibiscus sabdariffa]|uniref:Uncharacterized protein n=1 Tax=Hibiscus sabdariffa TaxID=183260 RepID=A0ABR2C7Z9_9ROSI
MEELNNIIWAMIIDSYGFGEKYDPVMINYKTMLRMMKYMAPSSEEYRRGLHAHSDKLASTIICEDQTPGLEIEGKDGRGSGCLHLRLLLCLWLEILSWCGVMGE